MSDEIKDLKDRCARLELLYRVSKVIHSTLDPQRALELVIREVAQSLKATSGSIALIHPTTNFLEIQAAHGLPKAAAELKMRVGEGITGWVARTGKAARVGDVRKDRRYIELRPNIRSELAAPLHVNGELRGVINVDSTRQDAFSDKDQTLLEEFARQAVRVINNTWLYEQFRLKAQLFESLVKVGKTIHSTINLVDALNLITRESCVLMKAKTASVLMLDESREWLKLRASFGASAAYQNKPPLRLDDSLLGMVVRKKKTVHVENVQTSNRYQHVRLARQEGLVSLLSVPLVFQETAIGCLNVYMGHTHHFSNEEIRILGALADFSAIAIEKARLYERIFDTEEQLRQNEKLSAIGLLAAEIAHEIRNPLTVMKMLFHSLDLKFPDDDPRSKDVRIMTEKMALLNRIVGQVLDFAKRSEPHMGSVEINPLVEDLTLLTRHKLRKQNVTLDQDLGPDLPQIRGDATQLGQAFLNLTLNAVEAMPRGGRLTITTRVDPPTIDKEGFLVVEFRDTGSGMTPEIQKRAFSSLLSSGKPKGVGLGLAIVNRVVESHNGEIQVRSRPGKGATFTIFLPLQ